MKKFIFLMLISAQTMAFMPNEGNSKMPKQCDYICQHPGLQEKLDSYEEQKRIMQQGIDESVAKQNEVDKMIRNNQGKLNHTEMCKMVSIYQSMDVYGNIQPAKYIEIYEKCLKNK